MNLSRNSLLFVFVMEKRTILHVPWRNVINDPIHYLEMMFISVVINDVYLTLVQNQTPFDPIHYLEYGNHISKA